MTTSTIYLGTLALLLWSLLLALVSHRLGRSRESARSRRELAWLTFLHKRHVIAAFRSGLRHRNHKLPPFDADI